MTNIPQLGHHFEICFSVDNLQHSIDYYSTLGFKIYSGGSDKGWCTMTDGNVYFAMFPDNFIEEEFGVPILFNYRGGNMDRIVSYLKSQGYTLSKEKLLGNGVGSVLMKDINENLFYFDTTPEEERVDIPTDEDELES